MDIVTEAGRSSVERIELQLVADDATLAVVWPDVERWLLRAPKYWQDHFAIEDIRKFVKDGKAQLWVEFDEGGPHIAAITEVIEYPKKRALKVLWVGGSDVKRAFQSLGYIEIWARRSKCETVEILGRPAWLRLLKPFDYREKAVYLEMDISSLWEM